jgi:hypothetical protein
MAEPRWSEGRRQAKVLLLGLDWLYRRVDRQRVRQLSVAFAPDSLHMEQLTGGFGSLAHKAHPIRPKSTSRTEVAQEEELYFHREPFLIIIIGSWS